MGRVVKRVPLDFDWPIGKTWPGYMFFGLCGAMEQYIKDEEKRCNLCRKFGKIMKTKNKDCPALDFDKRLEPPLGAGYQLWETTSEGSPMSPVFATPELLARFLQTHDAFVFGDQTTTYENWLEFIKNHTWAPSAVIENGIFKSGVDAMVEEKEKK